MAETSLGSDTVAGMATHTVTFEAIRCFEFLVFLTVWAGVRHVSNMKSIQVSLICFMKQLVFYPVRYFFDLSILGNSNGHYDSLSSSCLPACLAGNTQTTVSSLFQ